jgi:hypothetical protein
VSERRSGCGSAVDAGGEDVRAGAGELRCDAAPAGHGHEQRFGGPCTSGPAPVLQSRSVAVRVSPLRRAAEPSGGAVAAKSRTVTILRAGIDRGRPNGRRMSCWWIMASVSAIRPPNNLAVTPLGCR